MGILAEPKLEAKVLCEHCGRAIERLEDGILLDWNKQERLAGFRKRGVILHGPQGGCCHHNWTNQHRGFWAIYNLKEAFVALASHYGLM